MACSPVPKVGGAAAPSAPPVPTPMHSTVTISPSKNIFYISISVFMLTEVGQQLHTQIEIIIIITYSFNVKLTSAIFNNTSTRYIINPKACKRKRLIVCPKAKNNFNENYFQKNYRYRQNKWVDLWLKTLKQTNKSSIVIGLLANDRRLKESS